MSKPQLTLAIGAAFPGQAFLMAKIMDVFTLQGQAMIDRGNFFATMFIVMAAGCWVAYFLLGYSTNVIAQVGDVSIRLGFSRADHMVDTLSQAPPTNLG